MTLRSGLQTITEESFNIFSERAWIICLSLPAPLDYSNLCEFLFCFFVVPFRDHYHIITTLLQCRKCLNLACPTWWELCSQCWGDCIGSSLAWRLMSCLGKNSCVCFFGVQTNLSFSDSVLEWSYARL